VIAVIGVVFGVRAACGRRRNVSACVSLFAHFAARLSMNTLSDCRGGYNQNEWNRFYSFAPQAQKGPFP
jgi:hypothetical protein